MVKTADAVVLTLSCPPQLAPYLEEVLWGLPGIQSVELCLEGFPGEEAVHQVRVFVDSQEVAQSALALLASESDLAPCKLLESREVAREDWSESWKQHWHVSRITEKLVIRPTWEQYTPYDQDENVIVLDPGCAFGTGTHETTRLVLSGLGKLADEKDFANLSVLDIGTGTGILAIYAAKLGSRMITALDIDPVAVQAAKENMELNHVADRISASATPLHEMCHTRYDVILANILGPVIVELMPEIVLRLEPGGAFLASGIVEPALQGVLDAMEEYKITLRETVKEGDWYLLAGTYEPA